MARPVFYEQFSSFVIQCVRYDDIYKYHNFYVIEFVELEFKILKIKICVGQYYRLVSQRIRTESTNNKHDSLLCNDSIKQISSSSPTNQYLTSSLIDTIMYRSQLIGITVLDNRMSHPAQFSIHFFRGRSRLQTSFVDRFAG